MFDTEKLNFENSFFFKIRLEFKFQEHSYLEVSIQEQTGILISITLIPGSFNSRTDKDFNFKNKLEVFSLENSLEVSISRTD